MRLVDRRDLDDFNNDNNLNDSDVIEFYGFDEIHFDDGDVNEFYVFDDIHFINNSYNFHKIEWENIHVLNDSLFHIETYKSTSAGVHLSLFLISDTESLIFFLIQWIY